MKPNADLEKRIDKLQHDLDEAFVYYQDMDDGLNLCNLKQVELIKEFLKEVLESLIPERKDTSPHEEAREYGFNDCIDDIKSNLDRMAGNE